MLLLLLIGVRAQSGPPPVIVKVFGRAGAQGQAQAQASIGSQQRGEATAGAARRGEVDTGREPA